MSKDLLLGIIITILVGCGIERFLFKNPEISKLQADYNQVLKRDSVRQYEIDTLKASYAEIDHERDDLKEKIKIQRGLLNQRIQLRGMTDEDIDNAIAMRVERARAKRQHSDSLHNDH